MTPKQFLKSLNKQHYELMSGKKFNAYTITPEQLEAYVAQLIDNRLFFQGDPILVLHSKQDWINRVPYDLPAKDPRDILLWLDKNGNGLSIGADFMAAEEIQSYPVTVYKVKRVSEGSK